MGDAELKNFIYEIATRVTSDNVSTKFSALLDKLVEKTWLTDAQRTEIKKIAEQSLAWLTTSIKDFLKRNEYVTQGASSYVISTVTIAFCLLLKSFF